ncbi:MAG: hypothetical protein EA368_11320 [Leptolyngbya sp. DLM2.Bin27]|nr:MAG: hypothetical protein EA368_11320 [Leptolyngbya sp. DLM2.Bin27]
MSEPNPKALLNEISDAGSGSAAVDCRLKIDQMLSLIDSILPFEACLYHEIIPLSVESSHLHLGMVNPSDTVAVDYARKQASFIHCSLVPWPVAADWQRKMLSQYLSHAAQSKGHSQAPPGAQSPLSNNELLTFIVDSPDDLSTDTADQPKATPVTNLPLEPQPLELVLDPAIDRMPLDRLHLLPPIQMTQVLLHRALSDGIGRLYLERGSSQGRVLWSQDGVVQAAPKPLTLDQLQSVINELKRLTHLPLLPTAAAKQADIERLYQGDRVLLRLRLIAGTHGEEATLQVLRGAALKFYQQQQLRQLGEDALGVAQTLQKRITEIRDRARQSLSIESPPGRTLESLSQLLKAMEAQIEQIMQTSGSNEQ